MNSFTSKAIANPLSVGEKLIQAREAMGLELKDIAKKINISEKYLSAIESGQHSVLPGDIYAKNFLKSYAIFLGLDEVVLLKQFSSEQNIYAKTKVRKDFKKPVARISRTHLLVGPKLLRGVIVVLLALAVLVYLGGKVKAILAEPALLIESPAESVQINENFIEIAGQTEADTILSINGQQVFINDRGQFTEIVDLQKGVNIIEVTARNRHGRETKAYRQVLVDEPMPVTEEDNQNENQNENENLEGPVN